MVSVFFPLSGLNKSYNCQLLPGSLYDFFPCPILLKFASGLMHLFLYDLRDIGLLFGVGSVLGVGGETANPIFCLIHSPPPL